LLDLLLRDLLRELLAERQDRVGFHENRLNLIVIGDSRAEIDAAKYATKLCGGHRPLLKTIKFKKCPTVHDLLGQLLQLAQELDHIVQEVKPDMYTIIHQNTSVTETRDKDGRPLASLDKGTHVRVLEVVRMPEQSRVRGRLEDPAGWISLLDTETGYRWAENAGQGDLPEHIDHLGNWASGWRCVERKQEKARPLGPLLSAFFA